MFKVIYVVWILFFLQRSCPAVLLKEVCDLHFLGAVISRYLSLNGIVLTCPTKPSKNTSKKSPCRQVRPGGDTVGLGNRPEAWITLLGHTGIKERLFQTGSCGEEVSRTVAGQSAAFVSQATNGGEWRSRKSSGWLIHGLASGLCVDMRARVCVCVCGHVYVCVCVPCRTRSGWQIGKATDGPGSISTAGCCDVSILPSLTTAGQDRAVCVIACTCGCVSLSLSQLWACCFEIRSTITLFAKYNKGKSLSWRYCCRTVSTANIVKENTEAQQLVMWVFLPVFLCCVCW